MNSIKNTIKALGLVGILGACSTPDQRLEKQPLASPNTSQNKTVKLTPREEMLVAYQTRFNTDYGLALEAHRTYVENRSGEGVDKIVAQKALQHYQDLKTKMAWSIKSLRDLDAEGFGVASYAENLLQTLPK